ncbi:MAG: 1-deoxy-D-xylulose-5-phosphate synthase, partial [Lachnospiraceae bacterium]
MVLDKINKPDDIKKLNRGQYSELANDIRHFLVEKTSRCGGHLASNLGVVELTMALHLSFDFPTDKIIWDVGHQAYTHKILSGRKDMFDTLRCMDGLSGFPKTRESEFDAFDTGHSTTSISAGMGIAAARDLKGEKNYVISVIGDGSLTGGMAYEAFNNISNIKGNFIVVLNDNNMSISTNVGGISKVLGDVRSADSYYDLKQGVTKTLQKLPKGDAIVNKIRHTKSNIKHMLVPNYIFEDMGLTYLGPVDGHNIDKLIKIFKIAKRIDRPVLVHVVTQKGRGYKPAVNNPSEFHGIGPFDIKTGRPLKEPEVDYSTVFGKKLVELAQQDDKICAITAAMPQGTGLEDFCDKFPARFFDVGIAEEHAVTFAAGLAKGGMKPVVAVYSSFLQRGYDQILHDVCIGNLPVVFAVDRAGIVGKDGETHQGAFDFSYLSTIPNMTVIAPSSAQELEKALEYAFK